jgi:MFS family permease
MSTKNKLWSLEFIKILLITLCVFIAYYMQMTTLPMYVQALGGNAVVAGLITAVLTIASLVSRPIIGTVIDKNKRTPILIAGIFLFSIASFCYSVFIYIWLIVMVRCIQGIGFAIFSTTSATMVSDVVEDQFLAEGIGYYGITSSLTQAIAPAIGLTLVQVIGYQKMFFIATILAVLGMILTYFVSYEKGIEVIKVIKETDTKTKYNTNLLLPAFVMLLVAFAQGSISSFLPMYAKLQGISNISLYFTVNAIFLILSRLVGGKLLRKVGHTFVISLGMMSLIGALLLISISTHLDMFILAAAFYGFGYGLVQPTINVVTINIAEKSQKGIATATFYASIDAGYGVGSILWGFVAAILGYKYIYICAAMFVMLGFLAYHLFVKKKLKSKEA